MTKRLGWMRTWKINSICLVGWLLSSSAFAVSTQATACGGFLGVNCNNDVGVAKASASNVGAGIANRLYNTSAEATPGALHAYAFASAEDSGGQAATALVSFSDLIAVGNTGASTTISVTLSLFLDGTCENLAGPCYSNMDMLAGTGSNTVALHLAAPGMVSGTLLLKSGDSLPVFSQLQVGALAFFGSSKADFGHTGILALSSSTPGVSFVGESGHDYSISAVPEPGAWLLLLSGLIALAVTKPCSRSNRPSRA